MSLPCLADLHTVLHLNIFALYALPLLFVCCSVINGTVFFEQYQVCEIITLVLLLLPTNTYSAKLSQMGIM